MYSIYMMYELIEICVHYIQLLISIQYVSYHYDKFGMCMVCVWYVYGMCMVCAWYVYGMCMVCAWYVYGRCMVGVWKVYGTCMVGV